MLLNQISIILLNLSESSIISWNLLQLLYINPELLIIYSETKQALNSWLFKVVKDYNI